VIKNPHGICQPGGISRKRRWRVYINEIDYITSDWVILSGRKKSIRVLDLVNIFWLLYLTISKLVSHSWSFGHN
jgi:hypothetical protein